MFTGIISGLGQIVGRQKRGQFVVLQIDLAKYELNLGDSVACDGICLTVSKVLVAGVCEFEVCGCVYACMYARVRYVPGRTR